jgi:hypothetical protein
LLAAVAYVNGVSGAFVWDDNAQIVDNRLIQDPAKLGEAVTSDVWAFSGERDEAWTPYWRPAFVVWMIANFQAFGLDPPGWHVTTILLHLGVIVLGAGVLRRLDADPGVTAATLCLFAVHPVHVESVTWIAGATDPLLGVFFLGSYLAWLAHRASPRTWRLAVSLVLFAGATLSKEISVVFPALVFVTEWTLSGAGTPVRRRAANGVRAAWPYLAVVVVFLLARSVVLDAAGSPSSTVPHLTTSLLSAPAVLLFYLRQLFWPVGLGPIYPFQAVTTDTLGWSTFGLPLAVVVGVGVVAFMLARRRPLYAIAASLFALTIAPMLNIGAFAPERLVHDRFLYLASFGGLVLGVGAIYEGLRSAAGLSRRTTRAVVCIAAAILSGVFCVATVRYNRAWLSELSLWQHAIAINPVSPYALSNLGYHYREAGRTQEAKAVLERAIDIDPRATQARLDLGLIAMAEGRFPDAERRFLRVLEIDHANETALERLGLVYLSQGRLPEAIGAFDEARRRIPWVHVRNTINIAALLRELGRLAPAIAELEAIEDELDRETDPDLLRGFWELGELYLATGRTEDARRAFRRFLSKTEGARGPMVDDLRGRTQARLAAMGKGDRP